MIAVLLGEDHVVAEPRWSPGAQGSVLPFSDSALPLDTSLPFLQSKELAQCVLNPPLDIHVGSMIFSMTSHVNEVGLFNVEWRSYLCGALECRVRFS